LRQICDVKPGTDRQQGGSERECGDAVVEERLGERDRTTV